MILSVTLFVKGTIESRFNFDVLSFFFEHIFSSSTIRDIYVEREREGHDFFPSFEAKAIDHVRTLLFFPSPFSGIENSLTKKKGMRKCLEKNYYLYFRRFR